MNSTIACRYEKGAWSECTTGQMQRTDKLKTTTDPSCQATRTVNKNCNNSKSKDKKNKEERKSKNKENKEKGRM
jgi:pleiotrophin